MKILVLNAGSSSEKSCLYEISGEVPDRPPEPLWKASIDWTAEKTHGLLKVRAGSAVLERKLAKDASPEVYRRRGVTKMLQTLTQGETQVLESLSQTSAVGHRVVHGGAKYAEATRITAAVKQAIADLIPLAPNHNPAHLIGIEAIEAVLPDVPQIAVFDTAFHQSIPQSRAIYPLPYAFFEEGIRRYGFHGTSHQYCARRAAQIVGKPLELLRAITCHLGNGCSLAAVANGASVDTTMGFTPLEGLMMGTRSGSIDPAIPIYLMREKGFDADRLDRLLNKESGIKGLVGESGDMRYVLQQMAAGDDRARLAFETYVHRLKTHIGAMLAGLGGLDLLVFTGGVGENVPLLRDRVCAGFAFLGLKLDPQKNDASPADTDVAAADSRVRVAIVRAEEDWAIARSCWQLVRPASQKSSKT